MNSRAILAGAAMAFWAFAAGSVEASATYTYTGSPFTNFYFGWSGGTSVTGSMTLSAPLGDNLNLASVTPIAFSFTDGDDTITNLNTNPGTQFLFSTDSSGAIINWANNYARTSTDFIGSDGRGDLAVFLPSEATSSVGGSWALSATGVPEPASWAMQLVGLGCLGGAMRLRRQRLRFHPAR